jgi:hypothetical protein
LIKIELNFDLCIDVESLIEFIEDNSDFEWNDLCDMEYEYRKSGDFESETYPLIKLGEEDNRKFQYWCERFLESYNNKIGSRTVYILH